MQRVVVIPYQHLGQPVGSIFKLRLGDGTDRLSQSVGEELPLQAV